MNLDYFGDLDVMLTWDNSEILTLSDCYTGLLGLT